LIDELQRVTSKNVKLDQICPNLAFNFGTPYGTVIVRDFKFPVRIAVRYGVLTNKMQNYIVVPVHIFIV